MKNLKKVLALVLAFACAFTMFAGAAFTDRADFAVDDEVVDTLVELGVIEGYTDGSFRPDDVVTRAEMAKMIYVLRTSKSSAEAYNDDPTTFKDISSHWARGYIKYCQALGVIAGKSSTVFDPDAPVTTQEAAKMLLVTLGYDAERASLVGTKWASKTIALADENGLLEEVNCGATQGMPRQYAAQLIYNAIDTPTVVWRDDAYHHTNVLDEDNQTIGEKYMGLKKSTSILLNVTKTNGKETYELELDSTDSVVDWNNTTDAKGKALFSFTDVAKDYSDLRYKTVTVLYKDKDEVFGVFATSDNTEVSGILKNLKMDGNKVKLDGTKYDLVSNDGAVYINGTREYNTSIDTIAKFVNKYGDGSSTKYEDSKYFQPTEVSLLATDGTSNMSILKVKTFAVAQVTSVGTDYVNLSYKAGDRDIITSAKCEDDDWDWYEDIAKNDYVIVTDAGNYASGNGLIEQATVVSGKVNGTRGTDGVSIDDEWYTMAGRNAALVDRPNTNSNVEMVLVGDYVYYTDTLAGNIDDIALLVEAAPSGGVNSKWEARLIFADGSDKVVEIEKRWDDKDDGKPIQEFHEGYGTNPNVALSGGGSTKYAEPMLVSYEVSKDVYTLSRMGYANTDNTSASAPIDTNGYDAFVTGGAGNTDGSIKNVTLTSTDGASIARMYYESTGVVFVKYDDKETRSGATGESDASYKVVSGKTASGYDRPIVGVQALADKSGNSYYAQAAMIDLAGLSTGGNSDNYAVVLKNVEKKTGTANGTVYVITAWNGTEQITVTTDDSAANSMSKGDIFSYSGTGDDLNDIDFNSSKQGNYYVQAFDSASGDITLKNVSQSGDYYIADDTGITTTSDAWTVVDSTDTTILFVNSDDGVGESDYTMDDIELSFLFDEDYWSKGKVPTKFKVVGGNVVDADDADNTMSEDFAPSVRVYVDNNSDDQITVIVVDVNRNITEW